MQNLQLKKENKNNQFENNNIALTLIINDGFPNSGTLANLYSSESSFDPILKVTYNLDLTYDANGNLIKGLGKYYEYDSFNQLNKIRKKNETGDIIAEYFYDSGGDRVKKLEHNIGGKGKNQTTYYISDNFIQIRNISGVFNETYYYADGSLIASKDNSGNKQYYHGDHLGSTTLVTNQTGSIVEEEFYLPHGDVYSGAESSRYLYTAKELDKVVDLYYYGARYYQASIMRMFIQPDSVIADIYNPQSLNRYSYVLNNPYKYTDSSGNYVETAIDVGFIGYDIYTIIQDPQNSANYLALAADVGGAILPGVTGLGAATRIAKGADKVSDVAKTTEKIAQETADKLGVATNRFEGIAKHREAATTIKESGMKNLFTEISIKEGKTVPYGTKGPTRVDVISSTQDLSKTGITINPSATQGCCDFKFGKVGLSNSQSSRIARETGKQPKEVRPNVLQKVKNFFGGK